MKCLKGYPTKQMFSKLNYDIHEEINLVQVWFLKTIFYESDLTITEKSTTLQMSLMSYLTKIPLLIT